MSDNATINVNVDVNRSLKPKQNKYDKQAKNTKTAMAAQTVKALAGGKPIDLPRVVAELCYEGRSVEQIAKDLSVQPKEIRDLLHSETAQKLIDKEQEKRSRIMAHIPIANFANRLKRLEKLYQESYAEGDRKDCFKALSDAREETKILRMGENAEKELNNAPRITVNIEKFENHTGVHREFDREGNVINAVAIEKLDSVLVSQEN